MKIIVLLLFPIMAMAQLPPIKLTSRHIEKLQQLEGEKRLTRYLKYFKTDSARQTKEFLSAFADSLDRSPLPFDSPGIPGHPPDLNDVIVNQAGKLNASNELVSPYNRKLSDLQIPSQKVNLNLPELSPELLKTSQQSVSKILSKYREFANSTDLTHATRQTSMKQKPLIERFTFAFNFDIKSTSPLAIGIYPTVGYKFNTKFQTGVGANLSLGNNSADNSRAGSGDLGFKCFANYDILKSFFTTTEVAWDEVSRRSDLPTQNWERRINIGIGKRMLVHPKLYFTVTSLYNLSSRELPAIHPDRFSIRFGFQTSELVNRKVHPIYHPNK